MFFKRIKSFRVCTKNISLCNSLVFFCVLCLLFYASPCKAYLPNDSTKQKYDLNDPRNPDCPCHKFQKLAEDEYKDKVKNGAVKVFETYAFATIEPNKGYQSKHFTEVKTSNHSMKYYYNKFLFRYEKHHRKQKRIKVNYGICFKW